jgi:3-hydroxyisobutyrate dehydrogenase-like beta-hydroxyacid dehydrogenase
MRIAVLGLGIIGSIWARHLHADGHEVRAWNRSPKPDQPGWTPDVLTAVRGAELVLVVVADGPAVLGLLKQIAPALAAGVVVCQHSTIGTDETLAAEQLVLATGARFLDMPFTGSKPAAEQRQNVFFIGGDAALHATVEPVYARLAKRQILAGPVGRGMAMKLSFNLLIASLNQAMCEAQELARHAGIAPADWFDALEVNVARSGLSDLKRPKWLAGDWAPQFSIKHLAKDVRLAQRLAAEHGLAMPEAGVVAEQLTRAETAGDGDLDFAAVIRQLRP